MCSTVAICRIGGVQVATGTFRLFEDVRKESSGFTFDYVDLNDTEAFEKELQKKPPPAMIWAETPTNPLLTVVDLQKVAATVRKVTATVRRRWGDSEMIAPLIAVDNTFCTGFIQQPLKLGCDIVVISCSKYICGHSDVIGGAVVVQKGAE
jgi:cystathionine gamma-lyase